jgi:CRISPR-associated protein Csx3
MIEIDLSTFYNGEAKLADLSHYIRSVIIKAGEGSDCVLTGAAPIWMYLKVAHSLHGKVRRLIYRSPALKDESNPKGEMVIFDHSAY